MNAAQRRECILTRLSGAQNPVSASALAAELGVSRQIVVGDVALLRAGGAQIDATPRGYQLHPAEKGYTGILACVHRTEDEMRRELYTIVDQGGVAVDVAVENSLYGEIRANLNLASRYDVDTFLVQARSAPESLLSRMDRRRASAHFALPGTGPALSASAQNWTGRACCTAGNDRAGQTAPDKISIKNAVGLVYPQKWKNVG